MSLTCTAVLWVGFIIITIAHDRPYSDAGRGPWIQLMLRAFCSAWLGFIIGTAVIRSFD